ncbi:serine/threonine protein kinase [Nostoc linckia FACHB-104]|nr:serine/threonine protein kinase [Nostoc linckia FACHB-104]
MPWAAGQKLQGGKYLIEPVLGQGGFGITYKALQVELNRQVVIKTPNEHLSYDPEYNKYVDYFIRESHTLAKVSEEDPNPHIVRIIDFFREGHTYCLVMDFVKGETLFEAVRRRGALPEAEIITYIHQIGGALSDVHRVGLVHRDAHPGNIMLRSNGKAVLIDFGIAKGIVPRTMSTTNKAGNERFAPYEQMTRGSREPTVDVYCLAATLYYAVTGKLPTTSLARKLDDVPLTPPKQIIPSISDILNKAILKGMELEARNRPSTMLAWLKMLEEKKPDFTPIPPQPTTQLSRIISWGRLVGLSLSYLWLGYSAASPYVYFWSTVWIWIFSIAWALAVTWALSVGVRKGLSANVAWAMVWAVGLVLGVIVVLAGGGAGGVIVSLCWAFAVAWAWLWVGAEQKLREYFSKFPIFLILVAISIFTVILGWALFRKYP